MPNVNQNSSLAQRPDVLTVALHFPLSHALYLMAGGIYQHRANHPHGLCSKPIRIPVTKPVQIEGKEQTIRIQKCEGGFVIQGAVLRFFVRAVAQASDREGRGCSSSDRDGLLS